MGKVLFFSGAGLSADSGLGVFRGSGGLWEKFDLNKVCNFNTWLENYELVHEFYNARRVEYAKASSNRMHQIIGDLQSAYGAENVIVITQNVDDLLERGGCSEVLHVHGRINFLHCIKCGLEFSVTGEFCGGKCEKCDGEVFKPSIIFFGEQAPNYLPMYKSFESLTDKDMIAVIGTEGSVVPIGSIIGAKGIGIRGFRLLCNLEKSTYINDKNFDKVMYQTAVSAVESVKDCAENILKGG